MYDTIIIGAGAAGITAAIYAARANLKFEIISKDVGGLTLWSSDIENYTGYHNLTGIDLIEKFKQHMADYKIKVKEDKVTKVEKNNNNFIVKTEKQEFETKTVIICSGSSPRKLEVPGADKFEKKGLVYCATCDGPLFAGKDVVVIGGGDAALDAANTLINMGISKIYIINLNPELTGTDKTLLNNVLKSNKVEVINNAKTTEVIGDKFVNGLKYEEKGQEKTLDIQGVFVEIGHVRNIDFIESLVKLNDKKEIIVDKTGATNVSGIFAAGDVTDLPGKQTVIACGDGSRALLSAFAYITKRGK
ncbi:FAD-dependent oxidoreductase [Candidatus Woesearchaeota archaeon]|nr:FAD-dependent oxidoreductase [Candidatus Woesearchaeota archaeon]